MNGGEVHRSTREPRRYAGRGRGEVCHTAEDALSTTTLVTAQCRLSPNRLSSLAAIHKLHAIQCQMRVPL